MRPRSGTRRLGLSAGQWREADVHPVLGHRAAR
jgi:hypothetical protein